MPLSRRQALAALGYIGCSASLAPLSAQRPRRRPPARRSAGIVDVHSHFFPPSLEALSAQTLAALGQAAPQWSPALALEAMDRNGVARSIVGASWRPPLLQMERDRRRGIARDANEFAARMVQDHPGRFSQLTFLPMPDVDDSLAEIAYCLDVLKAPGVGMMTSYGARWQGDPSFAPILQELNRRKAVVFCHPQPAACCTNLMPDISTQEALLIEFPYDTGRAMVGLLMSGSFARHRDIRWIFCHGGGTLPALSGRVRLKVSEMPADRVAQFAPNGVDFEFRRQFYETGDAAYGPPMAALLAYVPASQVLFGTDFPYVSIERNLMDFSERKLPAADVAAIQRSNILRLMPQLA